MANDCRRSLFSFVEIFIVEKIPSYIHLFFILTTAVALVLFYNATKKSLAIVGCILVWLTIQTIIGMSGFYSVNDSMPPRFFLLIMPPFILIIALFATKWGRKQIDGWDQQALTYVHTVRVPVEITLLLLFLHQQIPQLMTFEGRNFDILSGLSAPIIAYFGYARKKLNKRVLLTWNIVCLCLLANIVVNAILSAESPFQQFAFDQPNRAVVYVPFIWLPCFIVPVVLLAHLASIRQLLGAKNNQFNGNATEGKK